MLGRAFPNGIFKGTLGKKIMALALGAPQPLGFV